MGDDKKSEALSVHSTAIDEAINVKHRPFIKELVGLCNNHGVMLATSGYDSIVICDKRPWEEAIYQDNIVSEGE